MFVLVSLSPAVVVISLYLLSQIFLVYIIYFVCSFSLLNSWLFYFVYISLSPFCAFKMYGPIHLLIVEVMLNIKHQMLNTKHQIRNIKHQMLNIKYQMLNIKHQILNIKHQMLNIKDQMLNIKRQILKFNIKHQMLNIKHQMLIIKHKMLNIKHHNISCTKYQNTKYQNTTYHPLLLSSPLRYCLRLIYAPTTPRLRPLLRLI